MPAKGTFALYIYDLVSGAVGEYSQQVEMLRMTNVSPGGFGQFEAQIKVSNTQLLRPELAIGSRIALMDASTPEPGHCRFLGELNAPEYVLDQVNGDYVHLVGEGLGSTLRDDAATVNYWNGGNGRSPQFILNDQMTLNTGHGGTRASYLVIDQDTSQILPDNPGITLAPAYTQMQQSDIIQDIATKCGTVGPPSHIYSWGVWAHPNNRDAAGFPTGQLVVHQSPQFTTTATYSAEISDIQKLTFRPDYSRCINVVEIGYNDYTQATPIGSSWFVSTLLNANGTQGSAPFRRRKYARNFAGTNTITAAEAQVLANAYGSQWSARVSFSTEIVLRNVRDQNSNPIPLWQVQADANIAIPDLARQVLAFAKFNQLPTALVQGTNVFYIVSAQYQETSSGAQGGAQELTLTLDNFADTAETKLERLQHQADWLQAIADATAAATQQAGAPWFGSAGGTGWATAGSQVFGMVTNYGVTLANTPLNIHIDGVIESTNVAGGSPGTSDLTTSGFMVFWSSNAAGRSTYTITCHTVGNTVSDVDALAGTFAHHCTSCEKALRAAHGCRLGCGSCREAATRRGLSIWHDVVYHPAAGEGLDEQGRPRLSHRPHHTGLAVWCPNGHSDHMNTAMRPEDENPLVRPHDHEHVAQWRALLRARGHLLIEDWLAGKRECTRPAFAPPEASAEPATNEPVA